MRSSPTRITAQHRKAVIDALLADHKRVRKIFKQVRKLDRGDHPQEYQTLVDAACSELKVHTALEEELLYPAARDRLSDGMLVDEAMVEHSCAKGLMDQLESMASGERLHAAYFKVLGEYVEHHIKEEERVLFPQLARAGLDWERLAEEMNLRRAELMIELMAEDAHATAPHRHASPHAPRPQRGPGDMAAKGRAS